MIKIITAIIALMMIVLSMASVSGQSIMYGYDQYGRINCLIYDYGNYRYLDYGFGIGHWEMYNGYTWQLYPPITASQGSNFHQNNLDPSLNHIDKSLAQLQLEEKKAREEMNEAKEHREGYERDNGWAPSL